jgi:hypothetical protein
VNHQFTLSLTKIKLSLSSIMLPFRIICILFIGLWCYSCSSKARPEQNYSVRLKLKSDIPIKFQDSSKIMMEICGASESVENTTASVLKKAVFPISSIDQEFTISFNQSDFQKIKKKTGKQGEFEYFLFFAIDVNNDGQICREDYVWDKSRSGMRFFDEAETGNKDLELYVKKSDICQPY